MAYAPHTPDDITAMLAAIGVSDVSDLFDEIPNELHIDALTGVPSQRNEFDVSRVLQQKAQDTPAMLNFIGAGAYEHHIPAAVWALVSRGEYLTAYTPYQAEASQGTLQLLYEFQTMMSSLTGMDVANASVYDGGSALAESILMALRANRKNKSSTILVAGSINPRYHQTAVNLTECRGIKLQTLPFDETSGTLNIESLAKFAEEGFNALVIQQPNFMGCLEQVDALTDWAHSHNALVIAHVNPTTLALLTPPGQYGKQGADIVCGEGQPLGVPLASGGPYFGFLCCKQAYIRQLPGRLVGRTQDKNGQNAFTLTLQAREQHIRRAKATSNICTNQGLLVTAATIYLSLVGPHGLRQIAAHSHANTKQLADKLLALPGVKQAYTSPFFHEVAIRFPCEVEPLLQKLRLQDGILAGIALDHASHTDKNTLLLCATETKTADDIDLLVSAIQRYL